LTQKIIEFDDTVPELPVKDIIFRIYRDIRFSKDPTPYKVCLISPPHHHLPVLPPLFHGFSTTKTPLQPHYSAAWSRTGRKGPYACYYVHAEPGKCFVGGGLWHPDGPQLAALRASIDERPRRWSRVLTDEAFCAAFLPKAKAGDEKSAKKAFAESNKEGALKKRPNVSIPWLGKTSWE
jgi:uncharacterized protein DUF2461